MQYSPVESPLSANAPPQPLYVLPRSGILQWRVKLAYLRYRVGMLNLLWYAIVKEVGSCLRNIELLRTTELHRRSVLPGPVGWMDRSVVSLEYCRACNEDIQTVVAKYPWASRVELQMIAAGWVLGEKRSRDNSQSDTALHTPSAL